MKIEELKQKVLNTQTEQPEEKKHISFSELLVYDECPHRWKLIYQQGFKSGDNIYSVFGNCIHEAIDKKMKGSFNTWIGMGKRFLKWCRENQPKDYKGNDFDYAKWLKGGFSIYSEVFDWLDRNFKQYELIESELKLYEKVEDGLFFKGFVDLFVRDGSGVYHIIDFKSTSWGWDKKKRSDTKKKYQIRLYKKFVCERLGIDQSEVKTHFVLLKRTPPKDGSTCELYSITSGAKSINNASDWLLKNSKNMKRGIVLKNRQSCTYCIFKDTEHCP